MATEKDIGVSPVLSRSDHNVGEVASLNNTYGETKRGLSPRHVQLMAIGGSIGTGLWVRLSSREKKTGKPRLIMDIGSHQTCRLESVAS